MANLDLHSLLYIHSFSYDKRNRLVCQLWRRLTDQCPFSGSNWSDISPHHFSENPGRINWYCLPIAYKLSHDFMARFAAWLDWTHISYFQKLSESFIHQWESRVNWSVICRFQDLDPECIAPYSDRVEWYTISDSKRLSDKFINRWADKLDWGKISAHRLCTHEFMARWNDKLVWYLASHNQYYGKSSLWQFTRRAGWRNPHRVGRGHKVSASFIDEHDENILARAPLVCCEMVQ